VLFVILVYSVTLVALDTYFLQANQSVVDASPVFGPLYQFLNDSVLVSWIRDYVIPVVGFVLRPFVPDDIDQFLGF